jgi:hypothetical protein
MCACTETDVRESANDCILASGEGHGSRGERCTRSAQQDPCPHPVNALYFVVGKEEKNMNSVPYNKQINNYN